MFITKARNGYFYLYYNTNGKRKKVSTLTKNKSQALKFLKDFNQDIKPIIPIPKSYSLSELRTPILNYVQSNYAKDTLAQYITTFKNLIRILGDIKLEQFGIMEMEHYKNIRSKEVKKTTCNIDIKNTKAIINLAIKLELITENKISKVKKFHIGESKILSMSETEVKKLLEAIDNPMLLNIVKVGLYSGCRISEILNIQRDDINFNSRILTISNKESFNTKTKLNRTIPLSEEFSQLLKSILATKKSTDNYYLFTDKRKNKYTRGAIAKLFKPYILKAGLNNKFHFHCLRHTFITLLIKKGVSINYVKELAGHTDIKTTMNYIHIVTDDLRDAVSKINITL
ncbi:MAG: site-specific integrase [Bacteroidetes bacterium]|nr:site-specific integrase [Bacteroidota bacterium]